MEDTLSKMLVVEYCSTHTGHDIQLSDLPFLDDVRLLIARKLQESVCVTQILDDVRDNCLDNNGIEREQLITRQDILNIGRKLNVHTNQKHSNGFLLAIQIEFQRDALLKFGPKVIFDDSTHGTNIYDFLLISVVIIDDHGDVFMPVAWAITNHEDAISLKVFFSSLAKHIHMLHPDVFMSDDADQFYSSFCDVFGNRRELLCS